MTERTLAQTIANFAVEDAAFGRLPADVVESVRERVLDVLGICVAATPLSTSAAARAFARDQGGRPQATAIGVPVPLPASVAGFVNGVLAHSLDYDDTHLPSVLHPSAAVIPAALAVAEANGCDGASVIAATAAGLEVCVRIGMAGYDEGRGTSTFFEHGQHATSIAGALGASVAAALLSGLDTDGVTNALGVAASMAAGIIEANRTGGTVKRLHCGWAANAGISAARLAAHGFTGPPTVFEGRFGFFEAWLHGSYEPAAITKDLGSSWSVPGIFFKPYPANHFTHAGIDAALALRARGVDPSRIERLTLGVPTAVLKTIGEPIDVKRAPRTGYMAQFSGPYTVVAALLGGGGLGLGLADFSDEFATDPERRRLAARVDVVPDARCDAIFPREFPAILRVRLSDGAELVEEVLANRGGPRRPLSFAELATKFRDNVAAAMPPETANEIIGHVARLDKLPNVTPLLKQLNDAALRLERGRG